MTGAIWTFVGHSYGVEPFLLGGLDVWAHEWLDMPHAGQAEVRDPLYGRTFRFPIYRISDGCTEVVFAAGEFSNNAWGFYRLERAA